MNPKLSDITPLYLMNIAIEGYEMCDINIIWYRSNEIFDIDKLNIVKYIKNFYLISKEFDDIGLPEYTYIIAAVIHFIKMEIVDEPNDINIFNLKKRVKNDTREIRIMVDDKSKFTRNNSCDHNGFVTIFSIVVEWDTKNNETLFETRSIDINYKLLFEKITLRGNDEYPNVIKDVENETIENDKECSICLVSRGTMVETSCKHFFHLSCLKCVPNLVCPLCRSDITDCLKNNGITDNEINYRLDKHANEIQLDHLCSTIDQIEINHLSSIQFITLCMESLKLNNGIIVPYCDLLFDMNANASHLFAKISSLKSKIERGVFFYLYDSPIDFFRQMKDPYSKSIVEWAPISDFDDSFIRQTQIYNMVKTKTDNLSDLDNEYVVIIMIENIIHTRIINKNTHPPERKIRIHQRDILNSIFKGCMCRCSGDSCESPNREFTWAKNKLKHINKRLYSPQHKISRKRRNVHHKKNNKRT